MNQVKVSQLSISLLSLSLGASSNVYSGAIVVALNAIVTVATTSLAGFALIADRWFDCSFEITALRLRSLTFEYASSDLHAQPRFCSCSHRSDALLKPRTFNLEHCRLLVLLPSIRPCANRALQRGS